MGTYAYDIECFKNLFTVTFVNVEDERDTYVFSIGLGETSLKDIKKFLKNRMVLVGYNNHSYDDPMLRYIMMSEEEGINERLHSLSSKLVDDVYRSNQDILELRYPKAGKQNWKSVDLMRMLAFDKIGISLKQVAINLKWEKIQDLPFPPHYEVQEGEVSTVLSYNLNDVLITKRLYEDTEPLRKLREELAKIYHVDMSSASDSKIANLILETIYVTEFKKDLKTIRTLRTPREKILLGSCIGKFINFQSPELKEVLDRIYPTYVYQYNGYRYLDKVHFANCTFTLGIGGLHTEDEPGVFVSDENYLIQDMDVASYYPNLIINNKFFPKHLGEDFIDVLKKITKERLEAKKSGDKIKADGLKITINSIFGKFGLEHFWLYDPKQLLSTTLTGQLGLLMLAEGMHLNGINVISANTDGIVCKIPREKIDTYYEIARAWEKVTNLQLEFTPYKKYVRRDVNSYITEKEDGSTKEKGAFLKEVDLKKGYHMPIVAKALHDYFIKGIPVKKSIESSKDIMDFCISQKTGGDFAVEIHDINGVHPLQKTNRFYISKKGGSLIKRRHLSNNKIGLYVGRMVQILNEYDKNKPFKEYAVDFSFYEKEVMKIIDEIEPKQMRLFDIADVGKSSIQKMSISTNREIAPKEEKNTVKELNKLGKNQFINKIEYIVKNNQVIENVSPRYVYVLEFSPETMRAFVYCLARGISQWLDVSKQAYSENKLQAGQVIYCDKFKKAEVGHSIEKFRISDNLEEEKEKLL